MPQNGLHQKPKSLCLCRVFYPFNPVRRNPKTCVTHRNFRVDKMSQYLSNFLTEFDLGNEIWQRFRYAFGMTGSYLSCVVNYYISSPISLHVSLFASLVVFVAFFLFISAFYLWRSHHFLWVKEKANEERDFVICMQREKRSYLPNMRAIQCNLAMIRRNVSIPSPYASYMMDGVFLW